MEFIHELLRSPAVFNDLYVFAIGHSLGVVAHTLLLYSWKWISELKWAGIAYNAGWRIHGVGGIVLVHRFNIVWIGLTINIVRHEVNISRAKAVFSFISAFMWVVDWSWLTPALFSKSWPWISSKSSWLACWVLISSLTSKLIYLLLVGPVSHCFKVKFITWNVIFLESIVDCTFASTFMFIEWCIWDVSSTFHRAQLSSPWRNIILGWCLGALKCIVSANFLNVRSVKPLKSRSFLKQELSLVISNVVSTGVQSSLFLSNLIVVLFDIILVCIWNIRVPILVTLDIRVCHLRSRDLEQYLLMGLQEVVARKSFVDSLKKGLVPLLKAIYLIPQVDKVLMVVVKTIFVSPILQLRHSYNFFLWFLDFL